MASNNNDYLNQLYSQIISNISSTQQGNLYVGGGGTAGGGGGNYIPIFPPQQAMARRSMNRFSNGDRVVLTGGSPGRDPSDRANPWWGMNDEYIAGTVMRYDVRPSPIGGLDEVMEVQWDNGVYNMFELQRTTVVFLSDVEMKARKPKKFDLDTTKLDALVIDPNVKAEIIALLQQHKHAKKIFEDWGLGEVIEYGKGMTLMFHGLPGTGKTWGAHCIAKALNKDLLIISAAEIQSSEPGGANRAIQQAFAEAKAKHKILFLDECDSLIANRAHLGMILSSEINTLLTEIEKTEEVVILATNMIENMDAALERRISLIVEFPMPDAPQRLEIWKKLIPSKMPLGDDVKFQKLAQTALTGGLIKNVVLQAARLAVAKDKDKVEAEDFEKAIERVTSSQGLMGKGKTQWGNDQMGVGTGVKKDINRFLSEI